MSLKRRALTSSTLVIFGHTTSQLIRLLGSLITTRLLAPELFGVMALATAFSVSITMLADAGLSLNVLRHEKGHEKKFLQTVYTIKVLQGCGLALVLIFTSALISLLAGLEVFPSDSAYANGDLPSIIVILAFSAFVRGFSSIEVELSQRNLKFAKVVLIEILSQACALAFVIAYASIEPTVYALAYATTTGALVYMLLSYLLLPTNNAGFHWDKGYAKDVFNFGVWIAGSSAVGLVAQHGDKFIFGALMSSNQLGQYAIASIIFISFQTILTKSNKIWLPLFSEIARNTPDRISEIYYRVRWYRDLFICLIAGVFTISGNLVIELLFDDRYAEAGWMFQILSLSFFIYMFQLKGQLITVNGDSKIIFRITLARAIATLVFITVGYYFFGIEGALVGYAIRFLAGTWTVFSYFNKKGQMKALLELRAFFSICFGILAGLAAQPILRYIIELLHGIREVLL